VVPAHKFVIYVTLLAKTNGDGVVYWFLTVKYDVKLRQILCRTHFVGYILENMEKKKWRKEYVLIDGISRPEGKVGLKQQSY